MTCGYTNGRTARRDTSIHDLFGMTAAVLDSLPMSGNDRFARQDGPRFLVIAQFTISILRRRRRRTASWVGTT